MKNDLLRMMLVLALAGAGAACSGDSGGDNGDGDAATSDTGGGSSDAGGEDTSGEDTGGEDTGGEDTGGEDTGGEDTGGEDTGGEDTGGEDTGGEDTGGEDTGGEDTGGEDTGGEDTGCDSPTTWYEDTDGDGLGDPATSTEACEAPAGVWVENGDDTEPTCTTNDTDDCGVCAGDNADMDCAGTCFFGSAVLDACEVCDGPGELTWYEDTDGDGFGDAATATTACAAPGEGWVNNGDDTEPGCATNDTDACGLCGGPGETAYYADTDGDGLGDPAAASMSCTELGDGWVTNGDDAEPDCATNDSDVCGICAGPGMSIWYPDTDGDGVGTATGALAACEAPSGYVATFGDPEPDCATDDTDSCGVCAGADADADCSGECFGTAALDDCGICAGGTTGVDPAVDDVDGDGIPDACDDCVDGRPGSLIVQWTDVPRFGGEGGPYTFQVRLFADGRINFEYFDVDPIGAGGTYGLQDVAGAAYVETGVGSAFPLDAPATWFTPIVVEGEDHYELDYFQPLDFTDITTIGTPLTLADDGVEVVEIGFPFTFYGTEYTAVGIGANGFLTLAGTRPPYTNVGLPEASLGAFIAPFWTDLNPERGGTIHMFVDSGSCELDCNGVQGGYATTDDCGVCTGGNTGLAPNADRDCYGDCFGTAYLDVCNICVEGNTGALPSDPLDCPTGVDLVVDEADLASAIRIDHVNVGPGDCLIAEGCVGGEGDRRVVRFSTTIGNIGTSDLQLGVPNTENPNWIWDDCHSHYHFDDYAAYDLYDVANDEVLPIGSKNGFCVLDISPYLGLVDRCNGYNCGNQGITAGCRDTYGSSLQCQWIDVTDVPDGVYEIVVTTNPDGDIPELDYTNNSSRVRINLVGETATVIPTP